MTAANDLRPEAGRSEAEVSRLLAGAVQAIGKVRYCWLVTTAPDGAPRHRPMGRVSLDTGEQAWGIGFITDVRSAKAADLRRDGRVSILFQHDPDDAFVTLSGKATLDASESEVRRRWKDSYNAYFQSEQDRANAAFVDVAVDRLELWIRGVTPEPYGMRTTILERDTSSGWRVVSR